MIRALSLIAIAFAVTGCISAGKLSTLPKLENPATACDVYVIRESTILGAALTYGLAIDQHDFVGIRNGQYTKIRVDRGAHVLTAKYPRQLFLGTAESSLSFEATTNRPVYLFVSPGIKVQLDELSEQQGASRVLEARFIDLDK